MTTPRGTASVAVILALGLGLGLGGCAAMKTGRARIVKAPPRCADQTVEVYFEPESAEVTKEGRAVIAAAAREGRPCKVASVDVMGLSDSVGGAEPHPGP